METETTETKKQPLTPFQELWLQALESGDYKQGHTVLKRDGCFCCLGVACDLVGAKTTNPVGKDREALQGEIAYVRKALRLRSRLGACDPGYSPPLTRVNDNGTPFSKIAAIIRKDPSQYFIPIGESVVIATQEGFDARSLANDAKAKEKAAKQC